MSIFAGGGLATSRKQHVRIVGFDRNTPRIGQRPVGLDIEGFPGLAHIHTGKEVAGGAGPHPL